MTPVEVQSLEALRRRIARFERRVRTLSLVGLLVAVAATVFWLGVRQAASQSSAISARTIVLVDATGRPRAVLASDPAGRPGIALRDATGKDRLWMGFTAAGTSQIALDDETGRRRAGLGFSTGRGDSQLVLFDAAGTPRVYFGFGIQLRTPQLVLVGERGKTSIYAGWTNDRAASVNVFDESGKVLWRAGAAPP